MTGDKAVELINEWLNLAKEVGVSSMYLQKAFPLMPGYTIAEYVRNRKLCYERDHVK